MQAINYQLILDELLKSVRPAEQLVDHAWMGKKKLICEFRSIGFKTTRQSGKTDFIAELVQQGKAVMITYEAYLPSALNQVTPAFEDRVLVYETLKPEDFDQFKDLGIKFICMDEFYHFEVKDKVYDKLDEVFGPDLVVIRT